MSSNHMPSHNDKDPATRETGAANVTSSKSSFFSELKRRKVFRVAATYIVVAWIIIQVAAATFTGFEIPLWAFRFVVLMLILGFPVALVLAWAFELTPDGIKLTRNVSEEEKVVSSQAKRNWMAIGFAAALPTAIFGTLAVYFYMTRSGSTDTQAPTFVVEQAQLAIADKSIAVLPFDNRSNLDEDQFFTDGIHDDLLTQISRIHDIKTISRTSVMAYRDTTKNMREIGDELGVATLLEGGVQRSGDRVRINIQLIDAKTDAHLWAESYTRELTAANVFEIQSEIAIAIAGALKAVLSPEEKQQLNKLPTQNLAALEAFFAGKAARLNFLAGNLQESIEHLKKAIALDPQFADAHVLLAGNYQLQVWTDGLPFEEQSKKAEPHIRRALELDPLSSDAHTALGFNYARKGNLAEADIALKRAIELGPNNSAAYAWYSNFKLWFLDDPKEAIALSREAIELDPLNPGWQQMFAEALFVGGQLQEAKTALENLLAQAPDNVEGLRTYGDLMAGGFGRRDEAIKYYRRVVALNPNHQAFAMRLARTYHFIEMDEETLFWLERTQRLVPDSRDAKFIEGMVHLSRGEMKEAESSFREVPENADMYRLSGFFLSHIFENDGRFEEALAVFSDSTDPETINDGNAASVTQALAYLHLSGKNESAQKLARSVLQAVPEMGRLGEPGYIDADAIAYIVLSEPESALDALQTLYETGYSEKYVLSSAIYDPLREDPRFQEFEKGFKARIAEQQANLRRWETNSELAPIPELVAN